VKEILSLPIPSTALFSVVCTVQGFFMYAPSNEGAGMVMEIFMLLGAVLVVAASLSIKILELT